MDKSALSALLIVLFPLLFAGMWCGVCLLLATLGGWRRLAQHYPARGQPAGRRFFTQGGKIGLVSYRGCLTIHTSPEGLHLSVWLPFHLGHPPLFIPWEAVHNARTSRLLWTGNVEFDVGSPTIATLRLSKEIFEGHSLIE